MLGTAKFIRNVDGFKGDARFYHVDPPIEWEDDEKTSYVIVSAIWAYDTCCDETFIFPATEGGEIIDVLELNGSFRGDQDHERALRGGGYEIA